MYFDLIPNNRENLENSIDIHRENKKQIQEKCQSFNIKALLQQKQWVKKPCCFNDSCYQQIRRFYYDHRRGE